MKALKLLIPIILAGFIFFSCGGGVVDPIDDVPTDLAINQYEDGKIELSWIYINPSDADTISFYVARKVGDQIWYENGWGANGNYGFNLDEETTSIIDLIPTDDTLVYAYKVRFWNHTTERFSNYSETIAYFSPFTSPTDFVSAQLSQEEQFISWQDNCIGEDGYKVDRKIGNGDWVKEYKILPANATDFLDNVTLFDSLSYRIYPYTGISRSERLEGNVFNSLAAPSNLETTILDVNKLRLNWQDISIGEDGFYIDKKIGYQDWQLDYAVVDSNTITYIDDFTLQCATMQYRVRAYKGVYSSNYSNIDTTNVILGLVGSTLTPGNALDVAIADWNVLHRTAYVADNYAGLTLIDCINPSQPLYMNSYELADRTLSADVIDNFAYVATQNSANTQGQISKVDIADELNPVLISTIYTQGIPKDIIVYGDFAYIAEGVNGLSIYYAASSLFFESNYPLSDARKLFFYSQYAFVANGLNGLSIIDVLDSNNPFQVSAYPTSGLTNDVYVENGMAYLADGENGLTILDISDINDPIEISQLETGGFAYGVCTEDSYVYLIDKENGLFVIDASNPVSPYVLGFLAMDTEPVSIQQSGSYVYITDNEGLKIVQVKP